MRKTITSIATAALLAASGCGAGEAAAPPAAPTTTISPSASPEPTAQTVELSAAGDEFDDPETLASWSVLTGDVAAGPASAVDIGATHPGSLTVVAARASWVNRNRGFYLFKQVEGDFMVTTRVLPSGRTEATPTVDWSLTGILMRAAPSATPAENWIGFTAGFVDGPTIERKTTRGGRSVLRLHPVTAGWIELRAVRIQGLFLLLHRQAGQPWTLDGAYSRHDLPARLQVGVNVGSAVETEADLVSVVDWIRFRPHTVPADVAAEVLEQLPERGELQHGYGLSPADTELVRERLLPLIAAPQP